jgi:hypothetical protein
MSPETHPQLRKSDTSYWLATLDLEDLRCFYSDGKGYLPREEMDRLVQDLVDGMPGYNPTEYFSIHPDIFNRYEHVLIAKSKQDGRMKGMLGARWFEDHDVRFLYLWSGFVATNTQKRGLMTRMFGHLMALILQEHPMPPVIAAKTYSPIWYKVMSRITAAIPGAVLYPRLGTEQDAAMIAIASRVRRLVTPALAMESQTGVIRGAQAAIGNGFFPPERPTSGTAELDRFFLENVTRDDQVLTCIDVSRVNQAAILRAIEAMKSGPVNHG